MERIDEKKGFHVTGRFNDDNFPYVLWGQVL